jgi:hypothetical protein
MQLDRPRQPSALHDARKHRQGTNTWRRTARKDKVWGVLLASFLVCCSVVDAETKQKDANPAYSLAPPAARKPKKCNPTLFSLEQDNSKLQTEIPFSVGPLNQARLTDKRKLTHRMESAHLHILATTGRPTLPIEANLPSQKD